MKQANLLPFPLCLRALTITSALFLATLDLSAQHVATPPPPAPSQAFTQTLHANFDQHEYAAKPAPAMRWLDNGNRYTVLEPSSTNSGAVELVAYETATGKRSILVSAAQLTPSGAQKPLTIDDYQWSDDGKSLLIFTNAQKVWRQRTRGDYWTLADGKLTRLGGDGPAATMMFAKFSPDAKSVAYVRNNNIYVQDLASKNIRQLTTDGSFNIINGTTDWVTEEELSLRDAFRWSPDSHSIAYWQFDQSGVGEFSLINDTKDEYPSVLRYKYPHPGGINASVRAGVISVQGGATTWIKLPGDPRNNYIPRLDWVGDSDQIALQYLNRLQNTNQVYLVDARTGDARMLFEDKDPAWVDIMPSFDWVSPDRSTGPRQSLLWISERDGWRHAYLVSRKTGEAHLITNFPADVISAVSIDETNGYFYFLASPTDPIRAYLYRVPLDGSKAPERITPADQSGHHTYNVSPNGNWAVHTYTSTTHPPSYEIVQIPTNKVVHVLQSNDDLVAKDQAINPQPVEFLETPVSGGIKLSTFMIKPPNFDPSRKYPVLVNVYSEPAATTVQDRWGFTLEKAIAREGYIVVSFDNQGTPAPRGREWRKIVYGAIGVLSSKQQAEAIQEFARQHPFVDSSRIGIWGHSGGGSATLNAMFRYPNVYKAGVSLAPVPDQLLYDSIYQEKYVGLPSTNAKGYHDGSPISFAEGLQGHLLVMHGSGDDNVHFQGTERLVNRLIELGKPFDFMDYPNRTHALSEGPGTLVHRYDLMMRFFETYIPPGPMNQ
jgi:dipeptidyl-peptidase-4